MATIARIIGTAGIRLTADARGLSVQMRAVISRSLEEATRGIRLDPGGNLERDADRSSSRIRSIFANALQGVRGLVSGFNSAVAAGTKLTLIAAAAGTALAGISSLATGVIGLIGVLGQASGVVGLLPAALLAVKAATATVQLGLKGVGDSFKALASGDAAAFQESLKNLAPAARSFMVEINKIKPAFDKMQLGVQERLFAGLSGSVQQLAQRYLPIAAQLFGDLATDMNKAAKSAVDFALTGEAVGRVGVLTNGIREAFRNLVPAVTPVLSAFLDISSVGSTFLPQLTSGIAGLAGRFGEFIRGAAESGQLAAFFQRAIDTVKQLGQVVQQFAGGLAAVFNAAQTAGGGFLDGLLRIATAFNQFTSSAAGQTALVGFFSSMRQIIAALLPVIMTVAQVIGTTLAPILAEIAQIILPVINSVLQQFGSALAAAKPGILALVQGLATLLEVFGPTITFAVQLAGILGGVLGKVLQTLAPVLARVANALLQGLMAIMPKLEPLILQVADAVVQLIDAAIPLIPLFLQLIVALLPLLPPLIQLVAAILPPLISLITSLMPVVEAFAAILAALLPPITAVAVTILNILIPPIQLIAAVVAEVAQFVAALFTSMSSAVTAVLTALGTIISGIWQTIVGVFTGAVTAIGNAVTTGFNAIKNAISTVLGGIVRAVGDGIENVITFFRELPGKVLGFLGNLASDAVEAGANIIRGIIRGLGNLAGAIVDKIKDIVSGAWNAVLDFFGIGSPSKLAEETFIWVGKGAIKGLEKIAPKVEDAAARMAADAVAAMREPFAGDLPLGVRGGDGAAAGVLGAGGTIVQQTNVMLPGTDAQQFADEVARRGAAGFAAGSTALPVSRKTVQAGMAPAGTVFGVSGG